MPTGTRTRVREDTEARWLAVGDDEADSVLHCRDHQAVRMSARFGHTALVAAGGHGRVVFTVTGWRRHRLLRREETTGFRVEVVPDADGAASVEWRAGH